MNPETFGFGGYRFHSKKLNYLRRTGSYNINVIVNYNNVRKAYKL